MRTTFPDRDDIWTPDEARRLLDEAKQSGESLAAFARRHGVAPARLYWWRSRLAVARPSSSMALVPAVIMPAAGIVIRLRGDVTIEVADARPETIAAIAAELARTLP